MSDEEDRWEHFCPDRPRLHSSCSCESEILHSHPVFVKENPWKRCDFHCLYMLIWLAYRQMGPLSKIFRWWQHDSVRGVGVQLSLPLPMVLMVCLIMRSSAHQSSNCSIGHAAPNGAPRANVGPCTRCVFLLMGTLISPYIGPSLLMTSLLFDATYYHSTVNQTFCCEMLFSRQKEETPPSLQGVFEENVWFSQPFRSVVSQRGQISTCSQSWNAAATCPTPLWASNSMFMRKWWTHGEIEGSHIVGSDAWEDMSCVVIPESMLLSPETSESLCLWSSWFDLIAAIWNISSDAETFEEIWVDVCTAFHTLKVPGQSGKEATGTILLRLAKYACTRRNECEYLETSHQWITGITFKTPFP